MFFQNIQITPLCNKVTIRYSHVVKQYIWYYCLTKIWNTLHGNVDQQYFQVQDRTMLLIFLMHNGLFLNITSWLCHHTVLSLVRKNIQIDCILTIKSIYDISWCCFRILSYENKNVKDTCQIHYFMKILNF